MIIKKNIRWELEGDLDGAIAYLTQLKAEWTALGYSNLSLNVDMIEYPYEDGKYLVIEVHGDKK